MLHPGVSSDDRWQQTLAALNARRFTPALPGPGWEAEIAETAELLVQEGHWLEELRAKVSARAAEAPRDPDGFIAWFENLEHAGPGQDDPLFPYLAEQATMDEMRWFLQQEVAGEAGFEDLTAMTQLRLPTQPKLELARNFWDEMGRGNAKGMHGPLLEGLARHLKLSPTVETTVWESLALANTMSGMAANRRYAYHSVGALGVIEQTAPGRAKLVGLGLRRLGVSGKQRHY
ncbi:MAG: iron-containing redox enzyme family protein, partial [Janthinobacterium lividum]